MLYLYITREETAEVIHCPEDLQPGLPTRIFCILEKVQLNRTSDHELQDPHEVMSCNSLSDKHSFIFMQPQSSRS